MAALRELADIEAAGAALAAGWPPLTQPQADRVAAILAPHWPALTAREPQAA